MSELLLSVQHLTTEFKTARGITRAVEDVALEVREGQTVGVVGESGSGKTTLAMSILGLVQPPGRVAGGEILFQGRDLLKLRPREFRKVLGREIGAVFQDPQTSLDPTIKIGSQVSEAIKVHNGAMSSQERREQVLAALALAGIPDPVNIWNRYPFELSGGMRQRVMIAIATANRPALLIADEPTTALDVTTQAQVVVALKHAQMEIGAATLLITHNLGLVAEIADYVYVMYAGHVVEAGDTASLFSAPTHPYTIGLMRSLPRIDIRQKELVPIPGTPPTLSELPSGCPFWPRCSRGRDRAECVAQRPALLPLNVRQLVACHFADEADAPSLVGASPSGAGQ
jgi:oligopeptide/dipeptide ABC transporter ATP-binding protein